VAYLFLVRRQDRINLGLTNESSRSGRWGKMIASLNVAQSQSGPSLLGTWRLVSYEARDSQGRVHYPLGENVSGLLVYDGGGNMSAHVMRNDRPFFAAKDPARGTDAELRAAFEDYGSYFGTYTIDQSTQTVTHQVRGAWYPNWIGHDQVRHFKFEGNRLLLSTPPLMSDGQSFEYVLTWERIS
jgi:Lipocalin-like domain